jgi:hypothetical protein
MQLNIFLIRIILRKYYKLLNENSVIRLVFD